MQFNRFFLFIGEQNRRHRCLKYEYIEHLELINL